MHDDAIQKLRQHIERALEEQRLQRRLLGELDPPLMGAWRAGLENIAEHADPHAMADVNREEIEAKLAVAEARTDTKFAQILGHVDTLAADLKGEMKALNSRMSAIERSTSGLKATVIITGIAIVGVVVAIMAYGGQFFGLGLSTDEIARRAADRAAGQVIDRLQR